MKQDIKPRDVSDIEAYLDERAEALEEIDNSYIGEVIGVAQAIDELKKAADEISTALDERQFKNAPRLGYRGVTSNFVFLQRTLARLQQAHDNEVVFISDIAAKFGLAYEEVEPLVKARIGAHRPKSKEATTSSEQ